MSALQVVLCSGIVFVGLSAVHLYERYKERAWRLARYRVLIQSCPPYAVATLEMNVVCGYNGHGCEAVWAFRVHHKDGHSYTKLRCIEHSALELYKCNSTGKKVDLA